FGFCQLHLCRWTVACVYRTLGLHSSRVVNPNRMRKMQHRARFATESTLTSPLLECRYAPANKKIELVLFTGFLPKPNSIPTRLRCRTRSARLSQSGLFDPPGHR